VRVITVQTTFYNFLQEATVRCRGCVDSNALQRSKHPGLLHCYIPERV